MYTPIEMERQQNQGNAGMRTYLYCTALSVMPRLIQMQDRTERRACLEKEIRLCIKQHEEVFDEELVRWADMQGAGLHRLDDIGTACSAAVGWMASSLEEARMISEDITAVFHNHPLPRHFCCSCADALVLLRGAHSIREVASYLEIEYALDFRSASVDPVQSAFTVLLETSSRQEALREADLLQEGPAFLSAAMIDAVYGVDPLEKVTLGIDVQPPEVKPVPLNLETDERSLHVEQGLHRFYLQMKDQASIDAMLDGLVDGLAQGIQVYLPVEACSDDEKDSFLVPDGRRMKLQRVKGPHEERIQPVFTSIKEVRKSPCRETMRKSLESVLEQFGKRSDVNRIGLNLFDEGLLMDEQLVDILLEAWWKTIDRTQENA